MKTCKYLLSPILTLCVLLFFQPAIAESQGLLDGTSYVGQNGEKGREANQNDTLYFNEGLFISESCSDYDFKHGKYDAWEDAGKIHFKATTISPTHGQLSWKGSLDGTVMNVTYIWTKKRWYWADIHREYWFNGTLKAE
ncbi:hypothetical protein ACMXYR_07100 [Neptuniibacter sp. QD29_5]|uniref:hypothetical protein n=1 Tax=Neptuniibacter sp. QD29_5 TaxID=3398207 RepID=UPI0039F4A7E0